MSTHPTLDSHSSDFGPTSAVPLPGREGTIDGLSSELIEKTRNQIRVLMQETAQLAQADISRAEFTEGFLQRVVTALASVGGVLWHVDDERQLRVEYQINLSRARLESQPQAVDRHRKLLEKVCQSGQALIVPPQSGPGDVEDASNPTEFLLILVPYRLEGQVAGIVEILQRPEGGPATQRGYLRFVMQMAELAADYCKNRRLRDYQQHRAEWDRLDRFARAVHRDLAVLPTAYTIANDGRTFVGCDRVTIVLLRGRRAAASAVSGLDVLEQRAAQLRMLERLVEIVLPLGQALWFGRGAEELPPQIEEPLHAYLDHAHSKALAIVPLLKRTGADDRNASPTILGAIVVEQMKDDRIGDTMRSRIAALVDHSQQAIANAKQHEGLFLMPLWRGLGRLLDHAGVRYLPRMFTVLAALSMAVLGLTMIQRDFFVLARGTLQPATRQDIFAQTDGTVVHVAVDHGAAIHQDALLVRMRNDELDAEVLGLLERQTTTREQIETKQLTLVNTKSLSSVEETLLAGELAQLREAAKSIEQQLQLLRTKQEQLAVRAPGDGVVLTWDAANQLLQRPVQRGQVLMTIADPSGEWELELQVPERQIRHVLEADQQAGTTEVLFTLKSHPGEEYTGRLVEVQRMAEVRGDEGNAVLVRVAIDKSQLPEVPSETTVVAKLHCGRRSLGYVWFGELLDKLAAVRFRWL